VGRSDMMLVLAPGCKHFDSSSSKNLCYRTFRQRAMCVYEMYSCAFAYREHAQTTALLVRNGKSTPTWISAWDFNTISLGLSTFSCCETNHEIISTCQRSIFREELVELIEKRVESLYSRQEFLEARLTSSMSTYLFFFSCSSSLSHSLSLSLSLFTHTHTHTDTHTQNIFSHATLNDPRTRLKYGTPHHYIVLWKKFYNGTGNVMESGLIVTATACSSTLFYTMTTTSCVEYSATNHAYQTTYAKPKCCLKFQKRDFLVLVSRVNVP